MTVASALWAGMQPPIYGADLLRQLTNPGVAAATTINSTVGLDAAGVAVARYAKRVGVELDLASPDAVQVGRDLVILVLETRKPLKPDERRAFTDEIDKLLEAHAREFGGKRWIAPLTDSRLTPTTPGQDGRIARPTYDDTQFTDLVPPQTTVGAGPEITGAP